MIRSGYFVEMDKKVFHKQNNVQIEITHYYKKKGTFVQNIVDATAMTRTLAEQVAERLKADSEISSAFCRIEVKERSVDEETVLLEHLWEVGEEKAPPPPQPTAVQELHRVIERCFEQGMTQQEIAIEAIKAVIG
jgi:hypothetical protein